MLIFLIKTTICLAAFFGLYKWLVADSTFYRANRLTLMSTTLLSLVLSAVAISLPAERTLPMEYVEEVVHAPLAIAANAPASAEAGAAGAWGAANWLALIYIIGVVACLVQVAVGIGNVLLLVRRTPVHSTTDEYTLLLSDDEHTPSLAWHRYIVMARRDFEANGEAILAHELAHTRLGHSYFITAMNIVCALLWANPMVWLMRRELLLVAEYEADAAVLSRGINIEQYQLLLIKKAVGPSRYTIANSLNHSSLKKRLTMMRTKKSNPWASLRYGYVVLVAAAVLPAFAHKDIARPIENALQDNLAETVQHSVNHGFASKVGDNSAPEQMFAMKNDSAAHASEKVYDAADESPAFKGGEPELLKFLQHNLHYPKIAEMEKNEGKALVKMVIYSDGTVGNVHIVNSTGCKELDDEAIRVMKQTSGKWNPARVKGKAVNIYYSMPIVFRLS